MGKVLAAAASSLVVIAFISGPRAEQQFQQGDGDMRRIVILGASYAKGWVPSRVEGVEFINAGVSGQQSNEMLARFESDVVSVRPQSVVLWGFINDIFRAPRADVGKRLVETQATFVRMVQLARSSGIAPIIATEVTITNPAGFKEGFLSFVGRVLGKSSYQDYVNGQVRGMNAWLREFAGRERLMLLDFEPILAGDHGGRARVYAADDGSHISGAGYSALDKYAITRLQARVTEASSAGTGR